MSKSELTFSHAAPPPTTARAAAYGARAIRKTNPAVGGGALPPIPYLNQEPPPELPPMPLSAHAMREQEQAARHAAMLSPVGAPPAGSIFSGNVPTAAEPSKPAGGLLRGDLLPDAAKSDPAFQQGAGSGYAVYQPHLARKYGVMRQGEHIPPHALFPSPAEQATSGKLSSKTTKQLEDIAKFQEMRAQHEGKPLSQPEQKAKSGVAAAAASLVNAPGDKNVDPLSEEERKKITADAIKNMDDFDFDTFRQAMMKDLLNNPEQREIIESRLEPLDLTDLIMENSITQRVVIIPDRFWCVFRSTSPEEDLAIKRLLVKEAKELHVDDRYHLDKFAIMALTLGLESINNTVLPSHKRDGRFDELAFWDKFNYVAGLNNHMCACLGLNFFWFDIRVRKLFVAEKIKNG